MTRFKDYAVPFISFFLFAGSFLFLHAHTQNVFSPQTSLQDFKHTVVIDPGHGGSDPGKVCPDGTLEKDLNLAIAKKLEFLLTASDIRVIMTRSGDHGLYESSAANKKKEDLKNRALLMNQSSADCVISIHQNSYPDSSVDGAQVFYSSGSESGKLLAALIQDLMITHADPSNHRIEKSNDSYYLFKNTSAPIVIIECGFLSNPDECKKLVDDTYQQKLAWAIHLGILQYLNSL